MNGHKAIQGRLAAFAGLTALVSTRIYPDVMPDTPTYPAVTYQLTSSKTEKGALTDPPLCQATFQITAWAKSRVDARKIADQIRAALDRLRAVTVSGVTVNDCFFEGDVDLIDFETRTYYVPADYRIFFRE